MATAQEQAYPMLDWHCNGIQYDEKIILRPFHLRLIKGQHVAILGTSGVGKTTLLQAIFDQLNNTSEKTALIPQHLGLVDNLSVYHNVYIGRLDYSSTIANLRNLIIPQAHTKQTIQAILNRLALNDKLHVPCGALSGGQQQRVAIARAIYRQASILIADEPVANLDQNQAEMALTEMTQNHTTCILALHNTEQAMRYCERIIGITNGQITLDTTNTQISEQELAAVYSTNDVQQIASYQ